MRASGRWFQLCLALGGILLLLALVALLHKGPVTFHPRVQQEVLAQPGRAVSKPSSQKNISTSPFQVRLVPVMFLDTATERPIARATIVSGASTATGLVVGKTDDQGVARLSVPLTKSHRTHWLRHATWGDYAWVPARMIEQDGNQRRVRLDVLAKLTLHMAGYVDKAKWEKSQATITSLPPVPEGEKFEKKREKLEFDRSGLADLYYKDLKKLGVAAAMQRRVRFGSKDSVAVSLPYTGEISVTVLVPGFRPFVRQLMVTQGEATSYPVEPVSLVTVSGRLLRDSKPVVGAKVGVGCRTYFFESEALPLSRNGGGGIAIWRKRSMSGRFALVMASTTTGKEGRFSIKVPFTDKVGAWAFLKGCGRCYVTRKADSRYSSVKNIELQAMLFGKMKPVSMLVKDEAGKILSNVPVVIREIDQEFQIQYPTLKTNAQGLVDIRLFVYGKMHSLYVEGAWTKYDYAHFRTVADGVIVVPFCKKH